MTKDERQALIRNVARVALTQLHTFSEEKKLTLLEGVTLLLPPDEALQASETARAIQRSLKAQQMFLDLFA